MELKKVSVTLLAVVAAAVCGAKDLTFENESFRLVVGEDAVAKSLVVKSTGEECLRPDPTVPLFSVTQVHPYNNEVKLVWPNKRTTYPANRIRREGDRLVVGFEIAPYEAVIEVKAAKDYIAFRLADFIVHPEDYSYQKQRKPPVQELRILQLPVRDRANYGCWLGVSWDERAAVGIVGANPWAQVDQERRDGYRVFSAWAQYGVKLRGVEAALVVAPGRERFLDAVDAVERDYGLPRGVVSRRSGVTKASIYWVGDLDPSNVDEHIRYAKEGGFRRMLVYYTAMCKDGTAWYRGLGDYDWRDSYPNGEADMRAIVRKVKAAGITPGLHVLQTHIGLESRYVTPDADPRLSIVRRFTLAKPLTATDEELTVLENPQDLVEDPDCRYLKFGGELIGFKDVSEMPPYRFTGLKRGAFRTTPRTHEVGQIGGLLDISEFAAHSCYIDQKTDLQDEIAEKIRKIYDCGFEFLYFDGSEGTGEPYAFEVPYGQYRVWRVLGKEPLFGSGAAKSHFGWHMLAGGNAFDIFKPEIFKAMIRKYPLVEAPIIARDFTDVNFGWWMFWKPSEKIPTGIQRDHWEYGDMLATACGSPKTVQMRIGELRGHPRRHDLLETLRRWEDVRTRGWLTAEQKAEILADPMQERHLHLNEKGEYELLPIRMLPAPAKAPQARGFIFTRGGKRVLAVWHMTGEGMLKIGLDGQVRRIPLGDLQYVETDGTESELEKAFEASEL